ncbi:MAG: hypothetical protein Q9187_008987, partial [Circinaria calcarea]
MAYPLRSARHFPFVLYQPRFLAPIDSYYANTKPPVIRLQRYANGYSGPPSPSQILLQPEDIEEGSGPKDTVHGSRYAATAYKMFEAAATTFATLAVLGVAGLGYHRYYKHLVLKKMENAFDPGDPVLELAALSGQLPANVLEEYDKHWVQRPEQTKIDAIVNGTDRGHYHLLIGEKGTGKSSMLLDAMQK